MCRRFQSLILHAPELRVQNYNINNLESPRSFYCPRIGVLKSSDRYVITVQSSLRSHATISTNLPGGIGVRRSTSNGMTTQIGLNSKATAVFEEVIKSTRPRPRYTLCVNEPTLRDGYWINEAPAFDSDSRSR